MPETKMNIIRNSNQVPVAYTPPNGCAIYYPGKDGTCVHRDGRRSPMDYSGLNFDQLGYTPLYKGDVVQFITTTTQEITV